MKKNSLHSINDVMMIKMLTEKVNSWDGKGSGKVFESIAYMVAAYTGSLYSETKHNLFYMSREEVVAMVNLWSDVMIDEMAEGGAYVKWASRA